jgi:hypothetical protein
MFGCSPARDGNLVSGSTAITMKARGVVFIITGRTHGLTEAETGLNAQLHPPVFKK